MSGIQFFYVVLDDDTLKLYTYYYSCRYFFLCCTNFVYSLSWKVLKDGGGWSGARRGPFFVGAWCEVFHSTRTSPPSVAGQYGDTAGPFVDRGSQQGTRLEEGPRWSTWSLER